MRNVRGGCAVLVGGLLVLAGCTDGGPTATPSVSAPTSSGLLSASPTTESPESQAEAAAEQVLRDYFRVRVQCLEDPPNTQPTCFDSVAVGTALLERRNSLVAAQQGGTHASGTMTLASVVVKSVDLANETTQTPPVVPTVVFQVCTDLTGYFVTDSAGKSVVPTGRPDRVQTEVGVANYQYPDASAWRVAYETGGDAC